MKEYLTDEEELAYFMSSEFKRDVKKVIDNGTWDIGHPKIYLDDKGCLIEHWKDGRIVILETKEEVAFNTEVSYWKFRMSEMDEKRKEGKIYTQEEIDLPYNELNRLTVEKLKKERG